MGSLGQEAVDHRLTYRDLDHTPDDGNRYEIIDGELFVTPFPTYAHQNATTRLLTRLDVHVREHGLGRVFAPGLKVVLDEPSGVGPDVTFVSLSRMDRMQEDGYHGAPDLIIEVLSSTPELDRHVKFSKYERAGVPHYWIVDPEKRTLSAYRLDEGKYCWDGDFCNNEAFLPRLFPGLSIELAELWI